MVMIRPKGKARNIAEMIMKGKGVSLPDSTKKEKGSRGAQSLKKKGKK